MEYFYIKQNATLPVLRMELVHDGKYEFLKASKFNNAIQNADVYFSMRDEDDVLKVSKAKCTIVLEGEDTCEEKYVIEYRWNTRDTKYTGTYTGKIEIDFNGDIYENGTSYENGKLIVPIYEELKIVVLP